MLAEPLLIRRPLMEVDGARAVGFDPSHVDAWIGLSDPKAPETDVETCRRGAAPAAINPSGQGGAP